MSEDQSKVLIVDDNQNNLDVLERRVTRHGYEVDTALNGRIGLGKIRENDYDLVLLDIMMPEMNGYQVLERIKEDPELRNLPVIVISAVDDIESIVRCIKLGAEDYLPKPFNPLILKARITASIEKKRLHDREEAHLEEQALSQRIARELNARLSLTRAAELTLDWALRRTSAHAGFVGQILDNGEEMRIISVGGEDGILDYYLHNILPIDSEEMKRAVEMIMPQANSGRDNYWLPNTSSRTIIPIGRAGQVIALLVLEDESEERYKNNDLSFLTVLSDRAAVAMSNAVLYEQVQKANLAKTEFVSEVSHELKNPMTSIRNYARMLNSVGEMNEVQDRFVQTIVKNVDRMSRLVSDLSDISRIESGHLRLELTTVDLQQTLDTIIASFEGQFETKNQALKVALPEYVPPITADQSRLEQILTNLISNAHKYSGEEGEIQVGATLEPAGGKRRFNTDMIVISVADNGIGLREDDQKKIFTKYFRAADGQANGTPGTGLGLRITKQLVELQGGTIWFESEYEKGTTFFFSLPTERVSEASSLSESS
ncbi:MAG: response regulator [Ardenticatenaceae bacterium]|nr:response regulator [Ardenticatenaceae bacterium]